MTTVSKRLVEAVKFVWQQIGPDVFLDRGENDMPPNDEVIEMCLDCDRLNPLMGLQDDIGAYADYQALKEQHGYHVALKLLAAHPQLQRA